MAPWDMFFAIPKIYQKIDPSNTHLLGPIFARSSKITEKNVEMRIILGPSWSHFLRSFNGCSFSMNFSHFSMKNIKNEKHEKVSPDIQITMFREGRQVEKNVGKSEKLRQKSIDFS